MATTRTASGRGVITLPGEGKQYTTLGITTTLKISSADSGSCCAVFEATFPPQSGMPAHYHHLDDEAVYVLVGELVLRVGDRTVTAGPGSFGFIPKETVHAMHNAADQPTRVLLWQSPGAGLAELFQELDRLPPGAPDMGQLLPLFERFDILVEAPSQ